MTDSDSGKRKKEDLDDLFRVSKKIPRTPPEGPEGSDPNKWMVEQMKKMMSMMKNLTTDVADIKEEQQEHTKEVKTLQQEIRKLRTEQKDFKEEIKHLKEINENMKEEMEEIKKEITESKERMEKLEGDKRRKNIVIQGIKMNTNDTKILKQNVEKLIETELGIKIKTESARKIGEKTCLVELISKDDKNTVMQNKSKLKNMQDKVYINDDLSKKEREIQTRLRKIAKEERDKGNSVKVGFQKLIIDQQVWKWNRENEKLEILTTKN
ncbi:hypothetical protein NQ318_014039 [Aromia moschata]|uniref:BRE1-like coiled-coil containing domain-containing protein n=1 Tax=Aromia moschata TaxID=1265417 RepID=A0AAV8YZA9_9CUCU|nr:hypothetical protein NQ318_014039 [Aromia moschata]